MNDDGSCSSGSLGFPGMDRSEFLARRGSAEENGGSGAISPHHYSGMLNYGRDDGSDSDVGVGVVRGGPPSQQLPASTVPSLQKRAMRRPSMDNVPKAYGGADDAARVQPRQRRRMPRRPSLDAIKHALDNEEDIANIGGKSRMPRRPSTGSLGSLGSLGVLDYESGDDLMPPRERARRGRMARRPSNSQLLVDVDGPDGAGRAGRMKRQPSVGSMGALAGGDAEQMKFSEQRKRVPRRASMEMNRRRSSVSGTGEAAYESQGGTTDRDMPTTVSAVTPQHELPMPTSASRRTSNASIASADISLVYGQPGERQGAAPHSGRSSIDSPAPPHPDSHGSTSVQRKSFNVSIQSADISLIYGPGGPLAGALGDEMPTAAASAAPPQTESSVPTPPPEHESQPTEEERPRRASMDGDLGSKPGSYRDMLIKRPSISAVDAERSTERTCWAESVKEVKRSSVHDVQVTSPQPAAAQTAQEGASENRDEEQEPESAAFQQSLADIWAPSEASQQESEAQEAGSRPEMKQAAQDVLSAQAFNQSRRSLDDKSKVESESMHGGDDGRNATEPPAKGPQEDKAADTFFGWNQSDAGTVTDNENDGDDDELHKKDEPEATEVYEGFGNRESLRESGDKEDNIEVEEEFDSRRPWRKAPANRKPEVKEAASESGSIMSFNMDGTNANVSAGDRQVEKKEDDLDGIGVRRMSSDSIGLQSHSDASATSEVVSEDLSEFAYAQAVLNKNMDENDDRPTRSMNLRRSDDPYAGIHAPEDDAANATIRSEGSAVAHGTADAAAIVAAMYEEEKAMKQKSLSGIVKASDVPSRRRSSFHVSDDSLDLETAVAGAAAKQSLSSRRKSEQSAEVVSTIPAVAADRSESFPTPLTQESAPLDSKGMDRAEKINRDSSVPASHLRARRRSSSQASDGVENTERTFQYWNDYGDLDRDRRDEGRDPLAQTGVTAADRVGAYKKDASNIPMKRMDGNDPPSCDGSLDDEEEARDHFSVGGDLKGNGERPFRSESRRKMEELSQLTMSSDKDDSEFDANSFKTVPTGNKKSKMPWLSYQGSSDRSNEVNALMDNFPANQKPRGRLERLVGPKVWKHRKQLFVALLVFLVAIVAVAVGLSAGRKGGGDAVEVPSASQNPSPTASPISGPTPSPVSGPSLPYQPVQTIDGQSNFEHAGSSVSFSSQGAYLAVGFRQAREGSNTNGFVRVYLLSNAVWTKVGADIVGFAEGDEFGSSLSLSDNGQRLAVGAPSNDGEGRSSGHVRVYELSAASWVQIGSAIQGIEAQDRAGFSVSLSGNGERVAVGAPRGGAETGSVRVFEFDGTGWVQRGQEIFGAETAALAGYAVSLSQDGLILGMSAPRSNSNDLPKSGSVSIYQYANTASGYVWEQMGQDIKGGSTGDQNGESVSLSSDGSLIAIGANGRDAGRYRNAGYCRVFRFDGNDWLQVGKSLYGTAQGEQFGFSVSLAKDGSRVACGGPNSPMNGERSGVVRVYDQSEENWSQIGESMSSIAGAAFGSSLSLSNDGTFLAIGAPESDLGDLERAGFADIYSSL